MDADNSGCSKTAFWNKVEIYRKQRNLTYRAIARTMGKAETTVSPMRQFGTEQRISDGIRIADALGVDIRDLTERVSVAHWEKAEVGKNWRACFENSVSFFKSL